MRKSIRFELETMQYMGGGLMQAEVSYADGRFTFVLSAGPEFTVGREELAALVQATDDEPDELGDYPMLTLPTQADAERWLGTQRGRIVNLQVRRKSGASEWRAFEVYRITSESGRKVVFAYQRDHAHYERIPLCNICGGQATGEWFSPRYEVEL